MIGVIGCILAFAVIIFLNYRDVSIFAASIIAALIAVIINGSPVVDTMVNTYFPAVGYYFGLFFGIYLFGGILGKLYFYSGAAATVSLTIMNAMVRENTTPRTRQRLAVIITLVVGFLLSYGGINCVVLVFTLYPLGLVLFEQADIPRKYLVGTIMGGTTAFAMTVPGSPQPPNIAAMGLFNTPSTAGLIPGIVGGLVEVVVIVIILDVMIARGKAKGEHFSYGPKDIPYEDSKPRPSFILSVLPLIITFILFNIVRLNIIFALGAGSILASVFFYKYIGDGKLKGVMNAIGEGASGSAVTMGTVAAAYGFGATMQATPGFMTLVNGLTGLQISPVILLIVSVAILAALTGGSGSSQQLAVPLVAPIVMERGGLTGQFIHRISCFAGSTFDTLPSSGAVLAGVQLSGIPMRECYPAIFITCVVATWSGTITVATLLTLFPGLA